MLRVNHVLCVVPHCVPSTAVPVSVCVECVCVCGGGGGGYLGVCKQARSLPNKLQKKLRANTHTYTPLLQVISKIINRIRLQETHKHTS